MIKRRKGFLLAEQTVKIIIALIAIIVLVFLLVSLYYNKVNAEKQRQAVYSLTGPNKLEDFISTVDSGEKEFNEVTLEEPLGWYLLFFTGGEIKPNACGGDNCVCICSNVASFNLLDPFSSEKERQIEECDTNGACLIVSSLKDYMEIEQFEVTKGVEILIKREGEKIGISKK